ncbi:MAG: peptidoglycan DD-metalloendopeptidase family protein [Alphaproteobacteria bacterium]|nr:peptidoglycan DD-metalloendopeptidase family protein [Alphaproteobacteria bacterium]
MTPPRAAVGGVTVQRGETLFAISRRTGVPVRALIDANELKPPYGLQTGQRLAVPANRFHEVQAGDTIYSVSRRYGVAMSELVRENRMQAPFVVRAGERLKIPAATAPSEPMVAAAPPPAAPAAVPSPAPPSAASPGAPSAVAAMPPSLPQRPGVLGTLPAPEQPTLPPERPAPPAAAPPPMAAAPSLAPPAAPAPPPPPSPPVARPPAAAEPPPREGRGFAWPVRGPVLTRFGPTGRGLHNDGINIAAVRGATVVASDAGVVAYAGNELRGFGNLLLIKHADGWVSAYAHNDALLVKRGDRVRRGQPIARVGQSGNVGEPQLHFELRRGTRAVDPAEYLETQSSGGPAAEPPAPVRPYPRVSTAALPGPG